ncbi:MAG TPA: hypothetical protein V6C81_03405 [Planktothrix sp.]|jgi:hypothetical protein
MGTIFLLYKKELTCLFRDKEILVYGVLIPLLLIPSIAILMMEGGLCYVGMTETLKTKVGIVADPQASHMIVKGFSRGSSTSIEAKNMSEGDADAQLASGALDAVVERKGDTLQLKVVEARDPAEVIRAPLATLLDVVCTDSVESALVAAHLRKSLAAPIQIDRQFVEEKNAGKAPQKIISAIDTYRIIWAAFLALLFVETMMTAIYAIIVPIVADVEQKTLLTGMMLPVPRFSIALAKYLAGVTATYLSAVQFCLSIVVATLLMATVMLLQLPALIHRSGNLSIPMHHSVPPTPAAMGPVAPESFAHFTPQMWRDELFSFLGVSGLELVLFGLALGVGCAFIFACASWARSAAEAQMYISLPVLLGSFLPLISMVPDLEANRFALATPIMNVFLLMKSGAVSWRMAIFIVSESLLLIFLCVALGSYLAALRNNLIDSYRFRFWAKSKNVT